MSSPGEMERVSPSDVRFIQKYIDGNFKDGRNVNFTIMKIKAGLLKADDIRPIRVIWKRGKFYSFDNRRLYVFRVLECCGVVDKIWVRVEHPSLLIESRFDTENDGVSVINRGGTTHDHIPPKLQQQLEEEEDESYSSSSYSSSYDSDTDYETYLDEDFGELRL